ncbi:MAG: efflux family protein [Betaproteobacteria bacterium]|nr:efflux family protein [Betaproteobacteria bacterium]
MTPLAIATANNAPLTAANEPLNPRTTRLLEGPIVPTLLKLAAPNLVVLLVQSSIGLIEAYWVGKLGTDALAGVALVFPALMLMQMMSAGAMGGGIASAIARAIGAKRQADANALVMHALLISTALGIAFTIAMLIGGRALYSAMGGQGAALEAALTYSNIIFAGIVLLWIFNALASVLRGTGNMALPALVTGVGAVLVIPLSPLLIFGWGPFPQWGIAGGAAAVVLYYGGAIPFLAHAVWSGRNVVRPTLRETKIRRQLLYDILRVGLIAAVITVTTNLTVALTTSIVGNSGAAAIAGYGIGSRLEYLLIPLAFSLGAPLVAMVGTCIGAGKRERALRAAWSGALIAGVVAEAVGLAAALFPAGWIAMFSADADVIAFGSQYLHIVGPFYGFFGIGMVLYFASQGAGQLKWPLIAGLSRLAVAGFGGWLAYEWTHDLGAVFLALGLALTVFGSIVACAVWLGAWTRKEVMRA